MEKPKKIHFRNHIIFNNKDGKICLELSLNASIYYPKIGGCSAVLKEKESQIDASINGDNKSFESRRLLTTLYVHMYISSQTNVQK